MKKMRKGFTLLELLVVIGVMGILSSTAMIAGQQATDAARATNIADGLEKAASAMMMFYADNATDINTNGTTAAKVAAGANAYLKKTSQLASATAADTYFAVVTEDDNATAKWYVGYTFLTSDTAIQAMIANKAKRMELYSDCDGTDTEYAITTTTDSTSGTTTTTSPATVYMRVR